MNRFLIPLLLSLIACAQQNAKDSYQSETQSIKIPISLLKQGRKAFLRVQNVDTFIGSLKHAKTLRALSNNLEVKRYIKTLKRHGKEEHIFYKDQVSKFLKWLREASPNVPADMRNQSQEKISLLTQEFNLYGCDTYERFLSFYFRGLAWVGVPI